jgi:anaerobic selenocysteine-containing dehydrogenase
MPGSQEIILTTCPRDCFDTCGIAVVKRHGVITHVRGDPRHPVSRGKLCAKCSIGYNREWRDPQARLTRPLRRVGPKGEGRFEPITWDAALATIADRLGEIAATAGPHTIINTHYTGTISLLAFLFPLRFFHRLGATEVIPDTICLMAGVVALNYVYGTGLDGFDPRTARDAACIVVWGANPSASGPHAHEHWLREAPGRVVVIDPIRTPTAQAADLHLQPFPGSDAALAFALLHVLWRDGLVDYDFVKAHTVGWEELEPLLADCTPAWGEAATGVPARLIEEAAHLYGGGPSLLWLGLGGQRQRTGGNVIRACALLPGVTGNLGKPGAGFLYLNWNFNAPYRDLDEAYLTAPHLAAGPLPRLSHMDLAACLEDPRRAQALVCWNMNIAASSPEQERLRRALRREDLFTVVLELFPTDTTDFADVVLPAASFLEFDDLVAGYFHLRLSAQVKAMEPLGEALPNQEIFRRLARAMGYREPELYESDAEILAAVLRKANLGEDFASLSAKGSVPVSPEPIIQFADLTFPTPSGRIEIASARAAADGHPRVPLPLADPRPAAGRLRLLSPASPWLLSDSFANVEKIAARLGPATIALHPADAAARGLTEGDDALVANETGGLALRVTLSESLPRGVALSHKGRWPKREPGRANVNALNPGQKSDMGENTCVHGVEVMITRTSSEKSAGIVRP